MTVTGAFGENGRYFTSKHQGLFVLAADMQGVSHFTIAGGLGANGNGFVDAATLEVSTGAARYRGFVKRVYGALTPSVNHLIVIEYDPMTAETLSSSTSRFRARIAPSGVLRSS